MTAFVSHKWKSENNENDDSKDNHFKIRFFTSICELDLCGHASVATAFMLFQSRRKCRQIGKIVFESKLKVIMEAHLNDKELVTLAMPSHPGKRVTNIESWMEDIIRHTLGPKLDLNFVHEVYLSRKFILIRLKDSDKNNLYDVNPDFEKLLKLDRRHLTNGIIVTQKAINEQNIHFFSRVFGMYIGVNEDPVCGSAHTVLTPYWKEELKIDDYLIGKQCSTRGGIVHCLLKGNVVELSGNAKILLRGEITV